MNGLPVPPTPLVGRADELASAVGLLAGCRLLTLVGVGGVGKTRLALEVAGRVRADHPDGVAFVDLAVLRDPAQVLPAVARALGLRDAGARPLTAMLQGHLRDRHVLLVIDNMEHVVDAAGGIAALLAGCTQVRVLATSRTPLQVPGEQLLPVEPLPVPGARCGARHWRERRASSCSSPASAARGRTSP